ncbi:MAG: DUF1549 domain-containing protein, partial [Verrucomicrobiales bacterium]|nr:DUF1549 domain-containing protein [Verrucomicrobiales bacterium]
MYPRMPVIYLLAILSCATTAAGQHAHWAFQPVADPAPPTVRDHAWPSNQLDHFILSKIEAASLTPAPPADKHSLVRRAYFDLVGLPPTTAQVDTFVADTSPHAFSNLVDQLLESPHYGERWGRHWLDVARYGDSNGGDENHAYPHAFRYRNWVIDAFNRDLPYDQFVRQQIAGDLIDPSSPDLLPPTGFLAIGTKILAEKDPVKKRADIVDEQIDTLGRAFMAMTLGCARCHDHKFDPVPETDYYALAGIFHSTNIEDRTLVTPEAEAAQQQRKTQIAQLDQQITTVQQTLDSLSDNGASHQWEAEEFDRGNIIVDSGNYGKGIGIIGDPGAQKNFVEYDIVIDRPGTYFVSLRYAAAASRPGRILVDGQVANGNAIAKITGGWHPDHQRWSLEAHTGLQPGTHTLRLESEPLMSHIDKIKITRVNDADTAVTTLEKLDQLENQRTALIAASDEKHLPRTMAVRDGEPADTRLNLRGNPHDLGPTVPRGFLSVIAPAKPSQKISTGSGRRQLADWITDPGHPLTARVI